MAKTKGAKVKPTKRPAPKRGELRDQQVDGASGGGGAAVDVGVKGPKGVD
jgi:hypothetical protein